MIDSLGLRTAGSRLQLCHQLIAFPNDREWRDRDFCRPFPDGINDLTAAPWAQGVNYAAR